jgi:hypothetical protein
MSVRGLDMNNEQVAELLYPALETEKGGIQVDAYQRDFELAVRIALPRQAHASTARPSPS